MLYAQNDEGGWEEIYRLSADQNRIEVSLDEVPDYVQQAFVASEDKRFWEHDGVDWFRTASVSISAVLKTPAWMGPAARPSPSS